MIIDSPSLRKARIKARANFYFGISKFLIIGKSKLNIYM